MWTMSGEEQREEDMVRERQKESREINCNKMGKWVGKVRTILGHRGQKMVAISKTAPGT